MANPNFIGLSHICVIVDDLMEAFAYYKRILGAVPNQCIPHCHNKGFFEAAGFVTDAEQCDISIGFLTVPGTGLTIEIMEYHTPQRRKESAVFQENNPIHNCDVFLIYINGGEKIALYRDIDTCMLTVF